MEKDCSAINGYGAHYREFTCLYPALKSFYFSFEPYYDPVPVNRIMQATPWVPVLACLLYGLGILFGRSYFQNRPAWNWRTAMAVWNLGLAVFSTLGFWRVAPHLLHMMSQYSIPEIMCMDPQTTYGSGSTGLWIQLFVLSKFPELFDTLFIVIHKKKLMFLHWYHHITVLLYCWHSYVTYTPSGIVFAAMNYGVHAVMYFYYFLMAIKVRPPWAMIVTGLQISQMFLGVIVTVLGFLYVNTAGCHIPHSNNIAAFLMYGSYLLLFLQFFFTRYFFGAKKKTA